MFNTCVAIKSLVFHAAQCQPAQKCGAYRALSGVTPCQPGMAGRRAVAYLAQATVTTPATWGRVCGHPNWIRHVTHVAIEHLAPETRASGQTKIICLCQLKKTDSSISQDIFSCFKCIQNVQLFLCVKKINLSKSELDIYL